MNNFLLGIKNLTLGIVAALSVTTPTIFPKATPAPTPLPTPAKNVVVRTGEYSYQGHTLKYTLRIPKNGGPITGDFSDACEGPITGTFDGQEGGNVTGKAEANCKVVLFNYNLKATYNAKLYLKQGKVDINWEGKIPYVGDKGSFTINFEPVN
ncbi:MAG: hypothetical protein M1142_02975 [Patescibacteria group bacterium]|nr:hypothetical protein [Patescibacteria group bacterium]